MANYDVIKTYGIEITAVTDKATAQINQLEKELDELSNKKGLSSGLQSQINKVANSLNGLKGGIKSNVKEINKNLNSINASLGKIDTKQMANEFANMQTTITSSIDSVKTDITELQRLLKDPNVEKGFASGIGKMFEDLSSTINGFTKQFENVSTVMQNIMDGSFDTSSLKAQTKIIKNETKTATEELRKMVSNVRNIIDDNSIDLDSLIKGELDLSEFISMEQVSEFVDIVNTILSSIDKLNNEEIKDIFGDTGLSKTSLAKYKKAFNRHLTEMDKLGAKERKKVKDSSEVRFKYVIDDDNAAVDSIVDKIKKNVIKEVEKKLEGSAIRIPIGYTYDKTGITDTKELEKIEKQNADKTIFEHIKLDIKADTDNLVSYVKDQVDAINKQLKDTKKQIEVEVVGKVNNETIDDSINDLQEEILHRQYDGSGVTTISGANINIGGDNIATETTLSNIRDILLDWNRSKSGTSSPIKELSQEDEKALFDYEQALKNRKRSNVLIKQTEEQLDVIEHSMAKLGLLNKQKSDLSAIRNSVRKGNTDKLHGSDYYSAYYIKDDVKYAKYGTNGETLDKWQEKLDSEFEETHKKIVEQTATLNDEFDGYLRGEKNWKELLIEDLKVQWAKDTRESSLEKAKLERADSVKLLMDRHNSNLSPEEERMTTDQAVLQLINSEYSERIKEIQNSNELTEQYEDQIITIKRKALNKMTNDLTKGYNDAILLTQNMIKAQERNIALNSDGSERNSSLRNGTNANRQGQANNPDEAANALNSELDQIDREAIEKHKAQQEITNDLKLQKNIMTEIVALVEKQKVTSLSDEENERLATLIQNLTLTKQELKTQENIEDVIKSITDLEEKRSIAVKNLESAQAKLDEGKKSGASEKVLSQNKNEIIKQHGIIAQLDLEIDTYMNQLDESIKTSFSENVDNLEIFIKTKLSSIDKLIESSTTKEKAIIGKAKSAKYDVASQYTLRDHSKQGYISRDKRILAISDEQSRLSKMIRYNRDGSYDTSAMTKLEENRYFNNIKILKDLKLQQTVYEAIYGKRAEILDIEKEESKTVEKTSSVLKNLPLSKKGSEAYLGIPTIFTADGTSDNLKGSILEESGSKIPENLKGLSLESAEQIRDNLSLVVSELTDYVGKEALKDNEKIEAKMRDVARKMVQRDIDALQRELTDNNEYIKQLKKDGANEGVIKSAKKRSDELSYTINQLKYSEVDDTALKEEIQNLERIKKLQEEIADTNDQNKIMDLAEQRAKSEERIAYLQENYNKASSVRESRIQLYVDQQKQEFEFAQSTLETKERELKVVNSLVSLKQKEKEETERIRKEEEIALAEKERKESLTEKGQKSNISKEYNSQIVAQEELIQKEKEEIDPLRKKSEELEHQLKLIKEQTDLQYSELILREKALKSLSSQPKISRDKKEDYKIELDAIPLQKENLLKQILPSNWDALAKSTRSGYKSKYLKDSKKYQSQFATASQAYNDAKYAYGDNAEQTLIAYKELVSVSEKLLDSSLKYVAAGGEEEKVAERILSASKIKYEHDTADIKAQKEQNDLLLREHEIVLKGAEATKSNLEIKKKENLDAIQIRKNEAEILNVKQQYINALEKEAKLKRKTGFYQGMSDEQYLAAYKVDAMLKLINDDQKTLNTLTDTTSDEYIEIANRIEFAKELLKEFRQEALKIDGLKLSKNTGRTYYKKDTKMRGVSYSGMGTTTAKDMSETIENAKAVTTAILEEHKAQTRVTTEVKETNKEYSELGQLRKFAGYTDEQVGLVEEIFKVNQQLQSNAKLSKEETDELNKQLKLLQEQAKLKGIEINRKGYARYLSGKKDFLNNPSKYDTNSLIHNYLYPQVQSDDIINNLNVSDSGQLALESTLQNIYSLLSNGKLRVSESLENNDPVKSRSEFNSLISRAQTEEEKNQYRTQALQSGEYLINSKKNVVNANNKNLHNEEVIASTKEYIESQKLAIKIEDILSGKIKETANALRNKVNANTEIISDDSVSDTEQKTNQILQLINGLDSRINRLDDSLITQIIEEQGLKSQETANEVKESSNVIVQELDKQSNVYKSLIKLAESYGIVVGDNVDITEKQLKNGNKVYDFKGEKGKGSLTIGTDKDGNTFIDVSKMQQLNDGYTQLQNTLREIKNLKGYKIDLLDESDPAMFGEYADEVTKAKNALTKLKDIAQNGYNGEDLVELREHIELVKQVSDKLKGNLQVGESEILGKIDTSRLNQVRQQLEELARSTSNGTVEIGKFDNKNQQLTYTVRTADKMLQTYTISMQKHDGQLKKTLVSEEKYLNGLQKAMKGLGAKFQEIIRYTIASVSIYEVFNFFKRGVSVVQEMDAAMTELRKVSNDTEQALQSFREESYKIANTIGSTGKEIVNSAADWQRLGYSIKEASELAKNSALYANVGDMEIDVATEHMVSTLKAFNIEAEDSITIVDKFNEIGNSYAITSAGIGEALERSASSLVAAGNDLDKSIALITAGNIVSQDAESVGNAMKVLSLRIRGSKTDLEEMGEETDGLASSTSKLREELKSLTGVDIMQDDNTYKDTYTILLEISRVWDQLTDVSQANVLEKLAGKTRSSVVAGLLQQGETLEKIYIDSQKAAGSAERENQKYMESIQGHLDILTNKWQEMWDSAINAEFINFFIDACSVVLDLVNKVGLLPSALAVLGAGFGVKQSVQGKGKQGYKIVLVS